MNESLSLADVERNFNETLCIHAGHNREESSF